MPKSKKKVSKVNKGASKELSRLSKHEFLALKPKKQLEYLEVFPESSHRFLLKGKATKKFNEKDEHLNERQKAKKDKEQLKVHIAKRSPKKFKKVSNDPDHEINVRAKKKAERSKSLAIVSSQKQSIEQNGIGEISQKSIEYASQIKQTDLHRAANHIEEERDNIHGMVDKALEGFDEFRERGMDSLSHMLAGGDVDHPGNDEPDFDTNDHESYEQHHNTKKKIRPFGLLKDKFKQSDGTAMLNLIIKASILSAGVGLMVVGAGPFAMVVGKTLLDIGSGFQGFASNKDRDSKVIDHVIDLTITLLRNAQAQDLNMMTTKQFKGFKAEASADDGVVNIMKFLDELGVKEYCFSETGIRGNLNNIDIKSHILGCNDFDFIEKYENPNKLSFVYGNTKGIYAQRNGFFSMSLTVDSGEPSYYRNDVLKMQDAPQATMLSIKG